MYIQIYSASMTHSSSQVANFEFIIELYPQLKSDKTLLINVM